MYYKRPRRSSSSQLARLTISHQPSTQTCLRMTSSPHHILVLVLLLVSSSLALPPGPIPPPYCCTKEHPDCC
ncbi:hypothetical protein PGTUg99_014940 [Puccinia graminis f. sp. tritici]|uniref:Uncharacterized protein n=1 Tax=Puccinia graminis f. sp. tritici TaxID=56615 RepID=A0A5B0LQ60_PUCGR|nr:hypothetical protein PGTUg99_014940 [Puccinia graminis f. sp. tritici]